MDKPWRVTVVGDGGWGSAVAKLLVERGHAVRMWGHDPAYLDELARTRENRKFLPGIELPEALAFEADLGRAVEDAGLVVVAVPTRYLRASLERAPAGALQRAQAQAGTRVLSLVKGLEPETRARPSEVIAEVWQVQDVAILSGPSHAEEVARNLPCTVTLAARDPAEARALQAVFMGPRLRVYTSTDVKGVELGGALKNVIAVAVGVCEGLALGDNARAALMTRGLAELARLGTALGGRPETFSGLSGMGDLITTCVSGYGRNRGVGLALARGESLQNILARSEQVPEGVFACAAARALAREHGVDAPITEALYEILHQGKRPREAVDELMTRAPKPERAG